MNLRRLSPSELLFLLIFTIIFVSLSLVVVFKSEWLDSFFYGSSKYEKLTEEGKGLDFEASDSFVKAIIEPRAENKAYLFLNLDKEARITGVELFLEKDESLKITDFSCEPPFECIFFDSADESVSLAAIINVSVVEPMSQGRVLVGVFDYEGSGSVYSKPNSESFVSEFVNPEFNILDLSEVEFKL